LIKLDQNGCIVLFLKLCPWTESFSLFWGWKVISIPRVESTFPLTTIFFYHKKKTNLLSKPIGSFLDIYRKNNLSYFAYSILSENTPYFFLLCSSYIIIIPTHRKENIKLFPLKKLDLHFGLKNFDVGGHHQQKTLF